MTRRSTYTRRTTSKDFKVAVPGCLLWAWLLMLTLGGIAHETGVAVNLSYLVCLGICGVLELLRDGDTSLAHFTYTWKRG